MHEDLTHIEIAYQHTLAKLKEFPGFDASVFERICKDTSADTVLEILRHFRISLQQSCDQLVSMGAEYNEDLVARVCHKLKGSSELLGFMGFSKKLQRPKQSVDADFVSGADGLIACIKQLADYLEDLTQTVYNL